MTSIYALISDERKQDMCWVGNWITDLLFSKRSFYHDTSNISCNL